VCQWGVLSGSEGRAKQDYECDGRNRNGYFSIFFKASQTSVPASSNGKNSVGKNHRMQLHGQVLPPCDCIEQIAGGGYVYCQFLRHCWGMGE
jgi:hypothetical protein